MVDGSELKLETDFNLKTSAASIKDLGSKGVDVF